MGPGDATVTTMRVRPALLVGDDGLIPKDRYVSREFLDLEMSQVWSRVWQVAGRQEELPDAGDYLEYTIGDQSILVVRTETGALRAFHNTCLHRGTRLAEGCGHFSDGAIQCPYHAWRYALDGRLIEIVDRHEFPDLPEGLASTPGAGSSS